MGAVSSTQIAIAAAGVAFAFGGLCIAAYTLYLKINEIRGAESRDIEMAQVGSPEVHRIRRALIAGPGNDDIALEPFPNPNNPDRSRSESDEFWSTMPTEASSAPSLEGERERGSSVESMQANVSGTTMNVFGVPALALGVTALPVNGTSSPSGLTEEDRQTNRN